VLQILALDGASATWTKLAFLTVNNKELKTTARRMEQPLVMDVHIGGQGANTNFLIPFRQADVARIRVDWGDGNIELINRVGDGFVKHRYNSLGDFVVRIFPTSNADGPVVSLDHLGWGNYTLEVSEWISTIEWWRPLRSLRSLGRLGIRSLCGLFRRSTGMNLPLAHLDLSKITDLSFMFQSAESFNQPIQSWNVSSVTKMHSMFSGAKSFNQPLGMWDVSNVVEMGNMFDGAIRFNQPINPWNVGRVEYMCGMFFCAFDFNQPLDRWDVSRVCLFSSMFYQALSFNQPIGMWNVSSATDMSHMFCGAGAFNQPIGMWDVSKVTTMADIFRSANSFDQDISGWDVSSVTDCTGDKRPVFPAQQSKFCCLF
jgi:surface protein